MKLDITNKKFGKLTAIFQTEKQDYRGAFFWLCRCDCGKTKEVVRSALLVGNNKSCGCLRSRHSNSNPRWKGCGELSGERFYNFKKNALRRKIDFDLSAEELWTLFEQQNRRCALTGDILSLETNSPNIGSLDRIENSKGYFLKNVRWIRSDINYMKTDMTDENFLILCRKVSDYNKPLTKSENQSKIQK